MICQVNFLFFMVYLGEVQELDVVLGLGQVIEDNNQPDLVGKYMFWKLPKAIWETINAKMAPSPESKKASIPVMDFLFGRAIDLEVTPGPDDP